MLEVERLDCAVPKYHRGCKWVHAKIRYPDGQFMLLKQRLEYEVKKTHIAYRITHWKFGVLTTLKWSHDNELYVQEDKDKLNKFALF